MNAVAKRISLIAIGLILSAVIAVGGLLAGMLHHFHPSAPPAARAEAGRRLDALEALGALLDRPHFRASLMRIDALADNGHSRVGNERNAAPLELPVRVEAFSDGLYVVRATDVNADLLASMSHRTCSARIGRWRAPPDA